MGLTDITLADGLYSWGVRLAGGAAALRETPQGAGPQAVPVMGSDLSGGLGRGPNQFAAGRRAWTLTPGLWLPAPRAHYASGINPAFEHSPAALAWQAVADDARFIAVPFTVGAGGFAAGAASVWLRRAGAPGALRAALHALPRRDG